MNKIKAILDTFNILSLNVVYHFIMLIMMIMMILLYILLIPCLLYMGTDKIYELNLRLIKIIK